ncbi:carbohydrate sulfotransferase 1-like [Lingula anatina]|uniref:Carbohydrate sulfotransferase 1-like n=1 Tax=Lingula anatina TaxID=7574 RepID=A0A1S3K9A1_LINAN|nr:carbohydrate sulfotransferase 1-like [Lingula anatina]|eukprot:XP_013419072.1 carbohydrate sulfotransferase 1-like [Lingula anatina]
MYRRVSTPTATVEVTRGPESVTESPPVEIKVSDSLEFFPKMTSIKPSLPVKTSMTLASEATTVSAVSRPTASPTTGVLIFGYYRSGSSFIGEMFNRNPNALYIFEPLFNIINAQQPKASDIAFLNGTKMSADDVGTQRIFFHSLIGLFDCDTSRIPLSVLWSPMYINKDRMMHMRRFTQCTKRNTVKIISSPCLPIYKDICEKATVKAIKCVRLNDINITENFLQTNPGIRVIHLLRDPRGALSSGLTTGAFRSVGAKRAALDLCERMKNNLVNGRRIQKRYPGRFFEIRYEDVAENPLKMISYVYKVLSLSITEDIKQTFMRLANGSKADGAYGTVRTDSNATAHAWKTKINPEVKQTIDSICVDVLKLVGYA